MEGIGNRLRKRSDSTNKAKDEFELPKIKKTSVFLRGKENNSIYESFSRKLSWVAANVDYSSMSDIEITEEFSKLKKELILINVEVVKAIEKVNFKSIKRQKTISVDPTRTLEIRDKEIENNAAILDRLGKEYLQLQKRSTIICVSDSKVSLDELILETKKECEKTKNKIKEIKLKNKSTGNSITNISDIYEQIRQLEQETDITTKKKSKLHHKNEHINEQISTVEMKIEELSDNFTIASNYFEEYENKIEEKEKQKEIISKFEETEQNLQILNKKNETISHTKQQKYHAVLKTFENQMEKLNILHQKITNSELEIINSKNLIQNYEAALRESVFRGEELEDIEEKATFFTEVKVNTLNSLEEKLQNKNTKNSSEKSRALSNANDGYFRGAKEAIEEKQKNLFKEKEHEKEKEFGDQGVEDDHEIQEFKIKVKEEQWKRNSKQELDMHMHELNSQLKNINIVGLKAYEQTEEFK